MASKTLGASDRFRRFAPAVLILAGIGSLLFGILPIAGVLSVIAGVALLLARLCQLQSTRPTPCVRPSCPQILAPACSPFIGRRFAVTIPRAPDCTRTRVGSMRQRLFSAMLCLAVSMAAGCGEQSNTPIQDARQAKDEVDAALSEAKGALDDVGDSLHDVREQLHEVRESKLALEQRVTDLEEQLRELKAILAQEREERRKAEEALATIREATAPEGRPATGETEVTDAAVPSANEPHSERLDAAP
jgi:DNA-binding transcriptional MerR regulator